MSDYCSRTTRQTCRRVLCDEAVGDKLRHVVSGSCRQCATLVQRRERDRAAGKDRGGAPLIFLFCAFIYFPSCYLGDVSISKMHLDAKQGGDCQCAVDMSKGAGVHLHLWWP